MHILIVDDEPASRTKLKTLMNAFGHCQTAENGTEGLHLFQAATATDELFEVVMLDIEMPDLNGTEVLQQMRQIEADSRIPASRRARIVMVTAKLDREQVMRCIQSGCDDYIAKPFNYKVICTKLSNLGFRHVVEEATPLMAAKTMSAEAIFADINRALRSGDIALPMQPEVSIRFRRLLDGNADIGEIAALLQKDMVIAAKVIRVANSALYRGFEPVMNIQQAIGRLGLTTTGQMVTALANQQLYATKQKTIKPLLSDLWRHSLATACAAETIAAGMTAFLAMDAFVAGLVHDIGALALIQIMAEMERRKRTNTTPITLHALTETAQTYHASFGGKLLKKWNFAHACIEAALHHNSSGGTHLETKETAVVHLADLIAKAAGYPGIRADEDVLPVEAESARSLQLGDDQIADITERTKAFMANAGELLSVDR